MEHSVISPSRLRRRLFGAVILAAGCMGGPGYAGAADEPDVGVRFRAFLQEMRGEALEAGIRAETFDRATAGLNAPDPRVLELNDRQPEFVRPVWDYLAAILTERRITRGNEMLATHAQFFDWVEAAYDVPREVVAAIWGMESAYGATMGNRNILQSLATLGFEGRRQNFGRRQFLAALQIAEREEIDPQTMVGSWAGAVGHTQFIPTSYLERAVDGDGDGKRDLWNSHADALASAANYLKAAGWRTNQRWGGEVVLPDGFSFDQADNDIRRTPAQWAATGLRGVHGEALDMNGGEAAIFLPAGATGPAFLTEQNFNVIMRYNNATSYALAIGLLSDRLAGRGGVVGLWPSEAVPLNRTQLVTLQEGLEAMGYPVGGADGILGARTRTAIRDYQRARGLDPDGYATPSLFTRVLNDRQIAR